MLENHPTNHTTRSHAERGNAFLDALRPLKQLLLLIVIGLLLVGVGNVYAQSGGGYEITRYVIANGGGEISGSGYTLNGTLGQNTAQTISGGGYVLYGGFWQPDRDSVPTGVGLDVGGNSAETTPFPSLLISFVMLFVFLTIRLYRYTNGQGGR